MVYPNTDYYILASTNGYQPYQSDTIHVGQNIVQFNISLTPSSSVSSGGGGGGGAITPAKQVTSVTLTSSNNPANTGDPVTLTAKVVGQNPTGMVTFMDGETQLGQPVPLQDGQAKLDISTLTIGTHTIMAEYSGDLNDASSTSTALTQTVAASPVGQHEKYVSGYPDGTFKPERYVTRAEMAAIVDRLEHLQLMSQQKNYSDVSSDYWANQAIQDVSHSGEMSGYPDGTFRPDAPITRGEMTALVRRKKQLPDVNKQANFTDVAGHWAVKDIAAVEAAGYVSGYADGTFRPDQDLTRAEAVVILNRVENRGPLNGVTTPTWSDVPNTYWAFGDIEEASIDHHFTSISGLEVLKP